MKKQGNYTRKAAGQQSGKTGRKPDRKPRIPGTPSEDVRLNRFIASSGICSRREADTYITAGLITVNDQTVTELGSKVKPGDVVKYNGQRIKNEKLVYILLNKPKDFVTTVKDPHATRTVMDLVRNACKERIFPVGRLDRNTTGVLLLTNDGDLTRTLTHPSYNKMKLYHVGLSKALTAQDMKTIKEGLTLDDGFIQADAIEYSHPEDKKLVGIEIHSGRNRIVRRIFEHLGYTVKKLDRVYFAGLTKKGLARGKWRFLTEKEISMLKMGAFR
ncbi:MAG: rRNA pseudouridine synthase [Bacteroidales bacterium]|nr:rRNA pseudouridine synthase [Bacteroidales bacterium]